MKKALTNNLGLKLLSLAVSILMWMIVINNENPVSTRTYTNIPVTVTNAEIVTNRGNTYIVSEETKTVSVTVTAKLSVLREINASNIKAEADMANLDVYSGTLIPIDVTVPGYTGVTAEATPRNIEVQIEMESTKTFPITPKSTGTPRDGYEVGELTVDPKEIEISGPESIVDSIAQVVAEVKVTGISKDEVIMADVIFYDADNKTVDTTLLKHNLGDDGVSVKVSVYQSKSVPIQFDTSKIEVASGYVFEGITIEPENIEIVGPIEEIKILSAIEIPAEALALTDLTKTEQRTIDISPYLPEWASQNVESAETPVIVKIHVTREGTKTIEFATGAISLVNVPKGYKVDYGNISSVEIIVKGTEADLEKLELAQGSVSINLIDIDEEGSYKVPLQVVLADGLELDEEIEIKINVTKLEESE